MKIFASAMVCITLLAAPVFSENQPPRQRLSVDWERGILTLEMTASLDLEGTVFPRARGAAERMIEAARGNAFLQALQELPLDSSSTVGEYLAETGRPDGRADFLADLTSLSRKGVKTSSVVSPDFRSLTVTYAYRFFGPDGVITPLIRQDRPYPLPEFPGYYPTREFTGLVIHARGSLLAFGKNTRVACKPALLPRIFYLSQRKTIEPVLAHEMVDPEVLESRGMLSYIHSADPAAYAAHVGAHPLTITAYAVYGTNDTDLVIAEDAARMLLCTEANRRLLRQGRVVVIID